MFSYIQYFPLQHVYGMMKSVNEINLKDNFFEIAQLKDNCIVFIINDDWRHCDLDLYTKQLINID